MRDSQNREPALDAEAVMEGVIAWLSKDAHFSGVDAGIRRRVAEALAARGSPAGGRAADPPTAMSTGRRPAE